MTRCWVKNQPLSSLKNDRRLPNRTVGWTQTDLGSLSAKGVWAQEGTSLVLLERLTGTLHTQRRSHTCLGSLSICRARILPPWPSGCWTLHRSDCSVSLEGSLSAWMTGWLWADLCISNRCWLSIHPYDSSMVEALVRGLIYLMAIHW